MVPNPKIIMEENLLFLVTSHSLRKLNPNKTVLITHINFSE